MNKYLLLGLAVVVTILPSCSFNNATRISAGDLSRLRGAKVAVTVSDAPFGVPVTTLGDAFLPVAAGLGAGIAGGNSASVAGMAVGQQNLASQSDANAKGVANQIQDPSIEVAKQLMTSLSKNAGAVALGPVPTPINTARHSKLVTAFPQADFILDVRPINCSAVYFPLHPKKYRVLTSIFLTLIDRKTGKTIAKGIHQEWPEYSDQSPTYDALTKNGAPGLRKALDSAAVKATAYFRENVFGL